MHNYTSSMGSGPWLWKSLRLPGPIPPLDDKGKLGKRVADGLEVFSPRVQAVSTGVLDCRLCSLVHRCHQQLATSRASATYNLSLGAMCCKKGSNHFHWSLLMVMEPVPHSVCLFLSTKSIVQWAVLSQLFGYYVHYNRITVLTEGNFHPCTTAMQRDTVPNTWTWPANFDLHRCTPILARDPERRMYALPGSKSRSRPISNSILLQSST